MRRLFVKRENRDAAWNAEGRRGRRSTSRNQLLHPMFVEDWPYPLSNADKGFGNNLYRTHFTVLYKLET